jgi:hypothetical protein
MSSPEIISAVAFTIAAVIELGTNGRYGPEAVFLTNYPTEALSGIAAVGSYDRERLD